MSRRSPSDADLHIVRLSKAAWLGAQFGQVSMGNCPSILVEGGSPKVTPASTKLAYRLGARNADDLGYIEEINYRREREYMRQPDYLFSHV